MKSRQALNSRLCTVCLLAISVLSSAVASGQAGVSTPPSVAASAYVPTMTFDVVSIKIPRPDSNSFFDGQGFVGDSGTLKIGLDTIPNILFRAYHLSPYQLAGVPRWAEQPFYGIEAKCDSATNARLAALTPHERDLEREHMMQAMLADRFSLKAHWEIRELPVYELVIAKGGPKLHPGGSMPLSAEERKTFGDGPVPDMHEREEGNHGSEDIAHSARITRLAEFLDFPIGTDVIDKTGLNGTYDFDLQFSQADDSDRAEDPELWPSIPQALEQQLGLKLERAKGPVRVLVVDHIDRPSAN